VEEAVVGAREMRIVANYERLPGRDPGDGFLAAVIKSELPPNA